MKSLKKFFFDVRNNINYLIPVSLFLFSSLLYLLIHVNILFGTAAVSLQIIFIIWCIIIAIKKNIKCTRYL